MLLELTFVVDPAYSPRPGSAGIAWAGDSEATVAALSGRPSEVAWSLFLDRTHQSGRPLLLELRDTAVLGSRARRQLAGAALGLRVAILAGDLRNRGVATSLRWLELDANEFLPSEISAAAAFLGVDPDRLARSLSSLDSRT